MQSTEITINLPYYQLQALTWGNKKKPPILCLHGWLDNAASFSLLAPLIEDYYIVSVDLPGHGKSMHHPLGFYYHFADSVALVEYIADFFGWQNFQLMGHSMGGGIASLYSGSFSHRVTKLILIEALGPFSDDAKHLPERLKKSVLQMKKRVSNRDKERLLDSKEFAFKLRHRAGDLHPTSAKIIAERGLQQVEQQYQWRRDKSLSVNSLFRFSEEQVTAFLNQITCPVCLIIGNRGFDLVRQKLKPRIGLIQELELHQVDGGHHLHLDNASEVAKVINNFLAS